MPLGGKLPYPGVYPDPLDPQGVQDLSNAFSGSQAVIPTQQETMSQATAEEQAEPATIPALPPVDGAQGARDDVSASGGQADSNAYVFQGMYGRGAMAPALQDEGSNYLPVGGPFGRDMVNEAFNKQPKDLVGAVNEGAQAQQQESKEKELFYGAERDRTRTYEAALKEQYMLRQQEMQQKQAQLEKTAQSYTNNLADQGAFWHNPQNIMAAIGASLMQLTTDDRSFGYKLLNGAIQSDLHNRRALADTHLGQLRSNMAEYDRIAGDKIAGMQLAEAEAKRVAAIELERIAAQFQGPKAKANAAAITAKLWQDVRLAYMDFYHKNIYNKPQLVDKRILGSYERGGMAEPGTGYTKFADSKNPRAGSPGTFEENGVTYGPGIPKQGIPAQGMGGGSAQGVGQTNGPAGPVGRQLFRPLSPEVRGRLNDRFPGGDKLAEIGHQDVVRRAYMAANVQPGTPPEMMNKAQQDAFNTSVGNQEKEAYEQVKAVSGAFKESSGRRAGLRAIQADMDLLEGAAKTYGIKMDDLLSSKSRSVIGAPAWNKLMNLYDVHAKMDKEEASKWQKKKDEVNAAGQRLMQLMSGEINSYYKQQSGAAVTFTEMPRLEQYASASANHARMRTFIDSESQKAHAEEREQMAQLSPAAKAMLLIQMGQGNSRMTSQSVDQYNSPDGKSQERSPKGNPKTR